VSRRCPHPDQGDFFGRNEPPPTYPEAPGYKEEGGTSQEAALAIEKDAQTVRGEVLRLLLQGWVLTADEIAARVNHPILTVRPRVSELFAMGVIEKLPLNRGRNRSGMSACRWRATRL
jgi:hypothetical protein